MAIRALFAWVREISRPLSVGDPARISALIGFAADAHADGADDLALDLLWRAAQRCWWGNASNQIRAEIFAAATELKLPEDDARLLSIEAYVGPVEQGFKVYERLAARAKAAVDDPRVAWVLALTANAIGAFELSVGWLTTVSAAFREQGRLGDLARILFARSWPRWKPAPGWMHSRNSAESARFGEETGQVVWMAAGMLVQVMVEARRGNFDPSEALAERAERLLLSPGTEFWRAILQDTRGVAALAAGRPAEAYQHLHRIWTPGDAAFSTAFQFYCLPNYVEAAVSCGQEHTVAVKLAEFERRSGPTAIPWVAMTITYSKALLALPEEAEILFEKALSFNVRNWPFRRGSCLLAYGEWLRRQRRSIDARAPLRQARDIFDALGAAPWGERARRELRAAGETSRPRAGRALDVLTPQELQIAELAASGLSNKEIGAKLYLSHRTIGYHLGTIFSKMSITSRAQLGRALRLDNARAI